MLMTKYEGWWNNFGYNAKNMWNWKLLSERLTWWVGIYCSNAVISQQEFIVLSVSVLKVYRFHIE